MIAKRLIRIIVVGAVVLLTGCGGNKAGMLQQLEQLEQQNHSGEPMLNDSLAEDLVSYFDRHGSANERMRSRYILGRTYYCLGELPRALELYNEAADCADTTAADCDFAKLSRVYAQTAAIYYDQVQLRSQLDNLRKAERYARLGKDTLMAIECYALQSDAYKLLNQHDSVIIVKENVVRQFETINRKDRAAQTIANTITSYIIKGNIAKARTYCKLYEESSGYFDKDGNIENGREVYYYIKGNYYLATHQLDSAEYMFRKELRDGKDMNNQIAGCKGLQEVFEKKKLSDSIAKYAKLGYELNDSAYSLSEMQNIQKFQASYNYNHQKHLAKEKEAETKIAWLSSLVLLFIIIGLVWFFYKNYFKLRNIALDYRLKHAPITQRFHLFAKSQPIQYPTIRDWKDLRLLVEKEIPSFRNIVESDVEYPLSDTEYDICVAIRVQLSPIEISKLKQCSPSTITKTRKKLLRVVFNRDGNADEFDDEIGKIGNS